MLQFYATKFLGIASAISLLEGLLMSERPPLAVHIEPLKQVIENARIDCENLDLSMSSLALKRLSDGLPNFNQCQEEIRGLCSAARSVLQDELRSRIFLAVPTNRARYYEPKEPLFGKVVDEKFPSVAYDVSEAGKCYVLHRFTGCVFHLMRVLEIGLRVFARRFTIQSDHANWHNVIEEIERAVRKMGQESSRPSDWKDQQEFFSQAASSLMLIKDAWRNYTAHARGKYTEEDAETMFINVRAFMQKLATRLQE